MMNDIDVEEYIKYYWLNLGDVRRLNIVNPFDDMDLSSEDPSIQIMKMMMKPENFYFTTKHLLNMELGPMQCVLLKEMWNRAFPMLIGSRGMSKTTMLAIFCMLKAALDQGIKIVVAGAGLRQSKLVFEYCSKIWMNSPMLRDLFYGYNDVQGPKGHMDKLVVTLGDSTITCIPIGDGGKIRGLRANVLIVDEFNSIQPEIFEVVLSGFTAVNPDPIESMKSEGRKAALQSLDIVVPEEFNIFGNQSIISGTCGYTFEHFYEYWKKWKAIIESKGDPNKLKDLFGGDNIQEAFNWKDYSVIRIPVELLPKGFMDDKTIAKAKVSLHRSHYAMEYGAVFPSDSDGFFKRSLIETCVAKNNKPVMLDEVPISFDAKLKGSSRYNYVVGVDPASEVDRFSVIVLEVHENHRRIVHCWTTQRKEFKQQAKEGKTSETDFYQFCARKIRSIVKDFPCQHLIMDPLGGGVAVAEALQNANALEPGELPILEIIEEDKEKPSDDITGMHILRFAEVSKREWIMYANNGMKKDFEDKTLLFPDFNASMLAVTSMTKEIFVDESASRLEECLYELEELKEELSSIVHTKTSTGQERWDTPETKLPGAKKGRMRKDRYSALLMANALAREVYLEPPKKEFDFSGRVLQTGYARKSNNSAEWIAPAWFLDGLK